MRIKFIQNLINKIRNKNQFNFKLGKESYIDAPYYIDSNCEIGSYTYVGKYSNITKAKIGNYCSIGNFVVIGPGEHNQYEISTSHHFMGKDAYSLLTVKDCTIGNDVWIGTHAIIRRGVKIGDGAIIGANSFVNKDVPDFAIVAGSPAKIIKYRFDDITREKIKKSNWYEKELKEAKDAIAKLKEDANWSRFRPKQYIANAESQESQVGGNY